MGLLDILRNAIDSAASMAAENGYDPNITTFYPGARARQAGLTSDKANELSSSGNANEDFSNAWAREWEKLKQQQQAQQPQPSQQNENYVFGPAEPEQIFNQDKDDESVFDSTKKEENNQKKNNKNKQEEYWDPRLLYPNLPDGAIPRGIPSTPNLQQSVTDYWKDIINAGNYSNPEPRTITEDAEPKKTTEDIGWLQDPNLSYEGTDQPSMLERIALNTGYTQDPSLSYEGTDQPDTVKIPESLLTKWDNIDEATYAEQLAHAIYGPDGVTEDNVKKVVDALGDAAVRPYTPYGPINRAERGRVTEDAYRENVDVENARNAYSALYSLIAANEPKTGLKDVGAELANADLGAAYSMAGNAMSQDKIFEAMLASIDSSDMTFEEKKAAREKAVEDYVTASSENTFDKNKQFWQEKIDAGKSDLEDQTNYRTNIAKIIANNYGLDLEDVYAGSRINTPARDNLLSSLSYVLSNPEGQSRKDWEASHDLLFEDTGDKAKPNDSNVTGTIGSPKGRAEQHEELGDWMNDPNNKEDVDYFFNQHPEYAEFRDSPDILFAALRMGSDESAFRDLFGYGNIGGIDAWRDRAINEGIDVNSENAWDDIWDLISVQKAFTTSDLASGQNRDRYGTAITAAALAKFLASPQGMKLYGDILGWNNIKASAAQYYPDNKLDEGDAAEYFMLTMLNDPALRASMSADDLLKAANVGLGYGGDDLMLGFTDDDSGMFVEDETRSNPRQGGYDYYTAPSLNPWDNRIMDQDMLDTYIAYINKQLEGTGRKVGIKQRS